ncbi:50S ribosomal protein L18 [Candidatus Halobeggiatoa sp. HSG11]|nr:50S ribosomal protein L18 [Candidatus Halobeggiatoa sp. HSG11]
MNKKNVRLRRGRRTRARIKAQGATRLCVHKTPKHIYAQIITPDGSKVLASASTLDKEVKETITFGGNKVAATEVGKIVALRAKSMDIEQVSFDRSGFKFHGRIKALADAARENGLKF